MTDTPLTAEDIAGDLRAAYEDGALAAARAIGAHIADVFAVHHDPPLPTDGTRDGPAVSQDRINEVLAFTRAMPDYRESPDITVRGNDIHYNFVASGVLPDGTAVSTRIQTIYTVEGGKLVRVLARPEAEGRAHLIEALYVGGFEFPTYMQGAHYDRKPSTAGSG
jgi:hypothetical protein